MIIHDLTIIIHDLTTIGPPSTPHCCRWCGSLHPKYDAAVLEGPAAQGDCTAPGPAAPASHPESGEDSGSEGQEGAEAQRQLAQRKRGRAAASAVRRGGPEAEAVVS